MINFDILNEFIEIATYFFAVGYLFLLGFGVFKLLNYKEYKNLEERKTAKLQDIYFLHKQLMRVKNPIRQSRILTRIDKIEKDIILIDKINWGLDYEEENCK